MKKGMMLLVVMLLGTMAFAQLYNASEVMAYNEAQSLEKKSSYEDVTTQIENLQRVESFPHGFYFDVNETCNEQIEDDACADFKARRNLFYLALNTFNKYKNDVDKDKAYMAAFNYAKALMQLRDNDLDYVFMPTNNPTQAIRVLTKALEWEPKDVQGWRLLYHAYGFRMFSNNRINDYIAPWSDERIIDTYKSDKTNTRARIHAFEQRENLDDRMLCSVDYIEAYYMYTALGQQDKIQGNVNIQKALKAEQLRIQEEAASVQGNHIKQEVSSSLLSTMIANMNLGR